MNTIREHHCQAIPPTSYIFIHLYAATDSLAFTLGYMMLFIFNLETKYQTEQLINLLDIDLRTRFATK